ncbi:MAG: transcriptional regulator GcvA [Pseudomonas marincola]
MSSNHATKSMPPLRTLQVFEAAARHQSFTAAGRDIGITQSAVSRQIADLEAYLKQELFIRSGPRLSLTRVGETLAQGLSYALADMQKSVSEARNVTDSRIVTLSMLPSVAAKWLAPQLGSFTQNHPEIDLRVSATRHLVDFAAEGIDAAIRYGKGEWPGTLAIRLGTERVQPVCTPEYAQNMNLKTPADLLRATLFWGDIAEDWRKWFTAAGVSKIDTMRGPKLGDDTAILQAVIDHQGVALGRSLLTKTDLETGRLIAPFPVMLEASYSYWLVSPVGHEEGQSLAAVKDWIIGAFVE